MENLPAGSGTSSNTCKEGGRQLGMLFKVVMGSRGAVLVLNSLWVQRQHFSR